MAFSGLVPEPFIIFRVLLELDQASHDGLSFQHRHLVVDPFWLQRQPHIEIEGRFEHGPYTAYLSDFIVCACITEITQLASREEKVCLDENICWSFVNANSRKLCLLVVAWSRKRSEPCGSGQ